MKKIILILGLFFCSGQFMFAQEPLVQTMPDDEEIMKIIDNYHLKKSEKEKIFKETKKRLQEIIEETKDPSKQLEEEKSAEEETKKPE